MCPPDMLWFFQGVAHILASMIIRIYLVTPAPTPIHTPAPAPAPAQTDTDTNVHGLDRIPTHKSPHHAEGTNSHVSVNDNGRLCLHVLQRASDVTEPVQGLCGGVHHPVWAAHLAADHRGQRPAL